jgi:hypothetical protein
VSETEQLRAALDEMFEYARRNNGVRTYGDHGFPTEAARDDALIRDLIQSAGVRRLSDYTVQAYREYLVGLRCSSKCPICGIDTPHTHLTSDAGAAHG